MNNNRFNPINGIYFTQGDRTFKLIVWFSGGGNRYEFINIAHIDPSGKVDESKIIRETVHGAITEDLLFRYMDDGTIKYHGFTKPIR